MPEDIPTRIPRLLASLKEEADQILNTNSVHDVMAHGWVDHDTPDQDYVGYTIWQCDSTEVVTARLAQMKANVFRAVLRPVSTAESLIRERN